MVYLSKLLIREKVISFVSLRYTGRIKERRLLRVHDNIRVLKISSGIVNQFNRDLQVSTAVRSFTRQRSYITNWKSNCQFTVCQFIVIP